MKETATPDMIDQSGPNDGEGKSVPGDRIVVTTAMHQSAVPISAAANPENAAINNYDIPVPQTPPPLALLAPSASPALSPSQQQLIGLDIVILPSVTITEIVVGILEEIERSNDISTAANNIAQTINRCQLEIVLIAVLQYCCRKKDDVNNKRLSLMAGNVVARLNKIYGSDVVVIALRNPLAYVLADYIDSVEYWRTLAAVLTPVILNDKSIMKNLPLTLPRYFLKTSACTTLLTNLFETIDLCTV